MTTPAKNTCRTCALALWQKGESGRVRVKHVGRCGYEFPAEPPPLPLSVDMPWPPKNVNGIWWDDKAQCPTWQAKAPPSDEAGSK